MYSFSSSHMKRSVAVVGRAMNAPQQGEPAGDPEVPSAAVVDGGEGGHALQQSRQNEEGADDPLGEGERPEGVGPADDQVQTGGDERASAAAKQEAPRRRGTFLRGVLGMADPDAIGEAPLVPGGRVPGRGKGTGT